MADAERREKARLKSERWRRAHGIIPRKPAERPWLAEGISRSTWYGRRKQVREREALTVVATAREAVFDRLDWQLARLRRELETAAWFADEGAAIITELAGYSGSSGRYAGVLLEVSVRERAEGAGHSLFSVVTLLLDRVRALGDSASHVDRLLTGLGKR